MINYNLHILLFFCLIISSCVENLIFIQLYPDNRTYIHYKSLGDSLDIHDTDFIHPILINSSYELINHDSILEKNTKVILTDSVFLFDKKNSLSYNYKRWKEKKIFSTVYYFELNFLGRKIKKEYPQLYKALKNDNIDSLLWLPEALTNIIDRAIKDINEESGENKINRGRIVNHFKNSFSRITSYKDLEHIHTNRLSYIKNTLKPFNTKDSISNKLATKMEIHEDYLRKSLELKDDSFEIKLKMPGETISTNASSFNKDTLIWKFGLDSLLGQKFTLEAASYVKSNKKMQKISILLICFLLIFGITLFSEQKK